MGAYQNLQSIYKVFLESKVESKGHSGDWHKSGSVKNALLPVLVP